MSRKTLKNLIEKEEGLDSLLRPKTFKDFVGQERIKKNLKIIIEAAKKRGSFFDHLLFYGGPGLGKTTLAYLIAKEANLEIKTISGPSLERAGDLVAILTNLSEKSILFIDEIHRLKKTLEEYLYSAMEEFKLYLVLGKGVFAKTEEIKLPKFTLIGATTKVAHLSSPLRNRFGAIFHLDYYSSKEIEKILERSARILKIKITKKAKQLIANCSRLTPRIANRLLKRMRDLKEVEGKEVIDLSLVRKGLKYLEIDEVGLEKKDREILKAIAFKFKGGPVGIKSLAIAVSEEKETVEEIYEPYLIKLGFLERTPRGRMITSLGLAHLKKSFPQKFFF